MQEWIRTLTMSLVYPFRDKRWLAKSWPLPVMALIPIVSLFAPVFYKGWRFCAVRQLAHAENAHAENTLPELDLGEFFRQGLLLWAFTLLYWLVPMAVCVFLGIGIFGLVNDASSLGSQGVQKWAVTESARWLWAPLIYIIWALISLPVYQSGMVRYAISGSWRSMLNVPANIAFFLKHFRAFVLFYISWFVLSSCIIFLGMLLSVTIIGVPLIPMFVLTAYYVTTAFELGSLARKVMQKPALQLP